MPALELLEIMCKYWLLVENSLNDPGDSGRALKSSEAKRLRWQGFIYSFTHQQKCAVSAGLVGPRGTSLRSTVNTSVELVGFGFGPEPSGIGLAFT